MADARVGLDSLWGQVGVALGVVWGLALALVPQWTPRRKHRTLVMIALAPSLRPTSYVFCLLLQTLYIAV